MYNAFIGGVLKALKVRLLEGSLNHVKKSELWALLWIKYANDAVLIKENKNLLFMMVSIEEFGEVCVCL